MSMRLRPRLSLAISVLMLASLACSLFTPRAATPTPAPTTPPAAAPTQAQAPDQTTPVGQATSPAGAAPTQAVSPTPPPNAYSPAFASYPVVAVKVPDNPYPGYTLPLALDQVQGVDGLKLSEAQKALLTKNGFVASVPVPGEFREFYQIYESARYSDSDIPLFVTTDAVFHSYHLVFDKMLRDLESENFLPTLKDLSAAMLETSEKQLAEAKGNAVAEPALRNVAFFAVACQLLGLPNPVPDEAKSLVEAELALIDAHAGPNISPIWDRSDLAPELKLIEDYSQYVPRGHYTRSEDLQRYFKAMMWYGRLSFRLKDPFETRRALLVVNAMQTAQGSASAKTLWESIYDPTTFIVGKSDDLTIYEYGALSNATYGAAPKTADFADDGRLAQFTQAARQLPAPKVNSMWVWINQDQKDVTQGFRFMGQRFTLDEYIFQQLIYRRVGTQDNPRMLPKGLDVFAAMGSKEAQKILTDAGESQYANYDTQMAKVQQEIGSLGSETWTQNLYWAWLYAFQPQIAVKDQRYPAFMGTPAWQRLDLNTVLGSWTELKHDTILYAKQVMAEMGGGGNPEPPKGYVEPQPEVYARLLSLAQMTAAGLDQRGLLSDTTKGNLNNLIGLLTFLQSSSEKELAGQALSGDDYNRIRYIGGELEALVLASADPAGPGSDMRDLSDQKAALIADVATGADANGKLVALEEADGQPTPIFVVLPDAPYRMAEGAIYSYYEFPVDAGGRMTDEQWQAMLEQGKNPPLPDWTAAFSAP
jgi:hypothetical protein